MLPSCVFDVRLFRCFAVFATLCHAAALVLAQQPQRAEIPSSHIQADLLRKDPITMQNWPTWRQRLLDWSHEHGVKTDVAFEAGERFIFTQANITGELPQALKTDSLAWSLLGRANASGRIQNANLTLAENAFRKSLVLDPTPGWVHRDLAWTLLSQDTSGPTPGPKALEADKEMREACRLDPSITSDGFDGIIALRQGRFRQAENLLHKAVQEAPDNLSLAMQLATAIIMDRDRPGARATPIKRLVERFADNGPLACCYGVALAQDNEFRAAARELKRARSLGTDPAKVLPPQWVEDIERRGAPGWPERYAWIMLYFAGFYAIVMMSMASIGVVLAARTRGRRALKLLQDQIEYLASGGQVLRAQGERLLAKLYALALFAGLVLFYLSIPFIILGLIGATVLLLYLIFLVGRIPVQLVVFIIVAGLGMTWAVFKSLFTRPALESFGIPKTAGDCPRLHQLLQEVAEKVDTDPVEEVYVAPGSAIGVHQEGRGPFGIFGIKRRVLTLGLSTMRFLTVGELQAILAHEYAHFSHRDTFYGRFIYQVHVSIEQALWGMGAAGGGFNHVNPFYWFLYLYYKCYSLLSAGFSRSREFLADRMASSLYGSDVFASALTKVSTDGMLFEATIYSNIGNLLQQQQAFVNMYEAYHRFRDEQLTKVEREKEFQKMLEEKSSLFAQHPTYAERIEAVAELPHAAKEDATPAIQLFDSPEEMEKELTQFLTHYLFALQHAP